MSAADAEGSILDRPLKVPEYVVSREFAAKTVLLNLQSGTYHGLNAVGNRMLEAVVAATTPRAAIAGLASEFEQPVAVIEGDLTTLLEGLAERGLVEPDSVDGD